jgi:hypothetical protein
MIVDMTEIHINTSTEELIATPKKLTQNIYKNDPPCI